MQTHMGVLPAISGRARAATESTTTYINCSRRVRASVISEPLAVVGLGNRKGVHINARFAAYAGIKSMRVQKAVSPPPFEPPQ